jgi:V-type H+-transporting ATPase proteolipid subunit
MSELDRWFVHRLSCLIPSLSPSLPLLTYTPLPPLYTLCQLTNTPSPIYAPFFGALAVATSIVFTSFGASYGMSKSSLGIFASTLQHPANIPRFLLPPILAGILSIYGLVVSVMISGAQREAMPLYSAFMQLGAGLSVGLCGLAAGFSIGIVGDAGTRASALQPRSYVGMVLILIFGEVLGLYGLIVALMLVTQSRIGVGECR